MYFFIIISLSVCFGCLLPLFFVIFNLFVCLSFSQIVFLLLFYGHMMIWCFSRNCLSADDNTKSIAVKKFTFPSIYRCVSHFPQRELRKLYIFFYAYIPSSINFISTLQNHWKYNNQFYCVKFFDLSPNSSKQNEISQ